MSIIGPVKQVMAARAIIVNKKNQILLVSEDSPTIWHTPGGWLDKSENLKECCEREVFEEIGIKIEPVHMLYISETFQTAENNSHGENVHKVQAYFFCKADLSNFHIGENDKNLWQDEDCGLITKVRFFDLKSPEICPKWLGQKDILLDISTKKTEYIEPEKWK